MPIDNDNNNNNMIIKSYYLGLFLNRHEVVDSYQCNRVFYKLYTNNNDYDDCYDVTN